MKPDRLRTIPLFEGLSDDDYTKLGRWTDEFVITAGKQLVTQGSYPHEFMVIDHGTAEVTHSDQHLAELGPGDFFGEMALLSNHPRMASIVAKTDITLVVLHERNFRAMRESLPTVAHRIDDVMAERQRIAQELGIET